MGVLREYIREQCLELYESLERSWDTAFDTWLSAINSNYDTYNSFPHLRNLEVYADKLVTEYQKYHKCDAFILSPIETYILLASILFHDIGKSSGGENHGLRSKSIIEHSWSILGIPNEELAYCIGQICEFHDKDARKAEKDIDLLTSAVIDPYGHIRTREIAAILMLIDHIDGSFRRVVPNFIKKEDKKLILGAFREKIRGAEIDLEGGMIKICLGDHWNIKKVRSNKDGYWFKLSLLNKDEKKSFEKGEKEEIEQMIKETFKGVTFRKTKGKIYYSLKPFRAKSIKQFKSSINLIKYFSIQSNYHRILLSTILQIGYLERIPPAGSEDLKEIPVSLDKIDLSSPQKIIYKEDKQNDSEKGSLPYWYILGTLLGNTLENYEALLPIKSTLSSIGLPIRGWLLEYNEHLYDYFGNETFEPVFTKEYLKNTAKSMWKLSTSIFAPGMFKYETLAAEMREPNLSRVYRAVKRISIFTQSIRPITEPVDKDQTITNTPSKYPSGIWYSSTHWKWKMKQCIHSEQSGSSPNSSCIFLHIASVIKHIDDNIKDRGYNDN